jgi:hypothetical protein
VNNRHHFRPRTARATASRANTLEQFGQNVRDWLHEVRQLTTRKGLAAAVSHCPPRLRDNFPGGRIADAFLAAQVEYLCRHSGIRPPKWTGSPEYVLDEPWFGYSDAPPGLRAILIRDAPAEFKNRNLFTTSEIEWRPRRGRPRKSLEEHREKTRLRLRRWRKANADILKAGNPTKRKSDPMKRPQFNNAGYQVKLSDLNGETLPNLKKLAFRPLKDARTKVGAAPKP